MKRGDRRAKTERVVRRRAKAAKVLGRGEYWQEKPGRMKKRSPVCYCSTCRLARKPSQKGRGPRGPEESNGH